MIKTLTKVSVLALVAGLTVGCASTSDLQKVQNDANEAKSIATDARSVSMATEEKINRMFKKSMFK